MTPALARLRQRPGMVRPLDSLTSMLWCDMSRDIGRSYDISPYVVACVVAGRPLDDPFPGRRLVEDRQREALLVECRERASKAAPSSLSSATSASSRPTPTSPRRSRRAVQARTIFSAESEARVCAQVMGDRRHGL